MSTRRDFIRKSAIAGMGFGLVVRANAIKPFKPANTASIPLRKNDVILFQGDSITDASREKDFTIPNFYQTLGRGYVLQVAGQLLNQYPEKKFTILNKGVSGNKVYQLAERWDKDCLELKPDVLSILIGVNDMWHTKTHDYKGTAQTYENDYRALLKRTVAALPEIKLVIGEPYALRTIVNPVNFQGKPVTNGVNDSWYPEFEQYQAIARRLANEFNATFIPYQKIYDEGLKRAAPSYWSSDGIHPSVAGTRLMADAWLKAIKA